MIFNYSHQILFHSRKLLMIRFSAPQVGVMFSDRSSN
jgi:hypothetical protein